jgi:hypothetical protein
LKIEKQSQQIEPFFNAKVAATNIDSRRIRGMYSHLSLQDLLFFLQSRQCYYCQAFQ